MIAMTKSPIILTLMLLIFAACQPQPTEDIAIPEDLAGKRAYLQTKKKELQELTATIKTLEEQIADLDPTSILNSGPVVTTSPITRTTFEQFVEVQGQVEADDRVAATAEVAGRILKMPLEEGDRVRAGQLIAELDLEQISKQKAELEISWRLAKDVYERQSRLWDQNIGSELQYLEAKNNVERLEKGMEILDFQMTKGKVYAPISGIIDAINLKGGELASPGFPIVTILNTARLQVVADLPENFLQNVQVGEKVKMYYPGLNMEQEGRIRMIGSTIDASNRTFKIEVNVGNPKGMLKPNLLVNVLIKDFELEDAVVIPLDLVQQEVGGKRFVIVTAEGSEGTVARKKYVEIGESYEGKVVITQGLTGTETLVIEGARGLANDDPIRIQAQKQEANNG